MVFSLAQTQVGLLSRAHSFVLIHKPVEQFVFERMVGAISAVNRVCFDGLLELVVVEVVYMIERYN